MASIHIDYDPESRSARLSAGPDCTDAQWSRIRRFFEERIPGGLDLEGNRGFRLPWWAFLTLRRTLRYVLSSAGIESLTASGESTRLLSQASEREALYDSLPRASPPPPLGDVQGLLKEKGFIRSLMPYQLRNVATILSHPAAATFSVPGSGKTTEALAYYALSRDAGDPLVVVAPKNAFVAWEDELPACLEGSPTSFVRLTGGRAKIRQLLAAAPEALIISYQQLTRVLNEIAEFLSDRAAYLFVDESHRIKRGPDGVQASSVLALAHLPKRKLILSGTPMPNATSDLLPQFSFLYPEVPASEQDVAAKIRRIYVRTTKDELGLEPPTRLIKRIGMSPAQHRLYAALASDAARLLSGLAPHDRILFRRVARAVQYMLQAASNPALLAASPLSGHPLLADALMEGPSPKLLAAATLARTLARDGHKAVIWSSFVGTVEHLAGLLSDVGALYVHGAIPTSEDLDEVDTREARVRSFNDPSSSNRVLVANPAACSEGISLHHVCHHAIYVDRSFNAAHYLQSEDRIHRIGVPQGTPTIVTILSSEGTIDDSVARRLDAKVAAMQAVLEDPNLNIQALDLDAEDEVAGLDEGDLEDLRRALADFT